MRMADTLSIGQVAGKTRLTRDTIRYYERLGLFPKPRRTPAGYRQYSESILARLRLIRNAQQFGFSLRDIASFSMCAKRVENRAMTFGEQRSGCSRLLT